MLKQKIIVRVDGNSNIGLGHIYRGIALAEMLKNDFDVSFITRVTSTTSPITDAKFNFELIPNNLELINEPDHFNKRLPKNTIIVLDGYDFTEEYQQKIKNYNFKLVYIDDLAIGTQKADLVINHSPGIKESNYKCEVYTKLALGLDYALLRQSFVNFDRSSIKHNTNIENIFVLFGGADSKDFTYKVVNEIINIESVKLINVVLGSAYKHSKIYELKSEKIKIYKNLFEIEIFEIMKNSDLAIVPASTTSIELASIGVPMFLGYYVDNQMIIYEGFVENSAVFPLGDFNRLAFSEINNQIKRLNNSIILENYYYRLMKMFNGVITQNVINKILVL